MALWHYSDLAALFQHWGTAGFAALPWNKLSHKMKPEEPVLRGKCRCCAPAPRATDAVTSMAFAEAQGEQQRLPGAGAATVPRRCWKGARAVTSCCLGTRLEGRGGQKVFRKPYPWPKKFTFDQNTHLKTHEFTSCFGEVQTSIHHGFWHSRVMLLGEDVKHHHKAGSCNGSKPPAAVAWCCVGTVLGFRNKIWGLLG